MSGTIRVDFPMRTTAVSIVAFAVLSGPLVAQESKPVPKDSVRVSIPGCTKGMVFTVGRRTADEPGSVDMREGMHLRMNGPKTMMKEIKAREGSMIEITGLMKKGQYQEGVAIGGGVRISPGPGPGAGLSVGSGVSQIMIDVEGWRPVVGAGGCPSR